LFFKDTAPTEKVEIEEEDRELAAHLLTVMQPEEIAAALVRALRARMPAPEELLDQAGGPPQRAEGPRTGFEDTIWFRMDIGRQQNADPRWILPLLCRRGHITKNEVGAIRIAANETMFEIRTAAADRFIAAIKRTAGGDPDAEGAVAIVPVAGKPRDMAKQNRRGPPAPRYKAKPYRGKPGGRG